MKTTIFGVRHHGPGCARSLAEALDELEPDCVLIEGPPEADALLPLAVDAGFEPPIAILVHAVDEPNRAVFYPFADFSPEWQALRYALGRGTELRFCDLPCSLRLRAPQDDEAIAKSSPTEAHDPLAEFARADGYSDSERWWNDRIEEVGGGAPLFAAITSAIDELRRELAMTESDETLQREAAMRQGLRQAMRDGFENIAFVCGAWHAPALDLEHAPSAKDDKTLLLAAKDAVQQRSKVRATWVPWTYRRLTSASGYGAGVVAPGWYRHLFQSGEDPIPSWIVRAARILRKQDLDASSASAVEATRLAQTLAALRGRPRPGLPECLEAIRAVFAGGEETWLTLLEDQLLVGDRLGTVPDAAIDVPLEQDIRARQRSLRLPARAEEKIVVLDLREAIGRERSVLLHRLRALGIDWGRVEEHDRGSGTFKEAWRLRWRPELAVAIVDASTYGNTVEAAAHARLCKDGRNAKSVDELVVLLQTALEAACTKAVDYLLERLRDAAATTHDVSVLLAATPPLCRMCRYGSARAVDQAALFELARGLATRAHVALPSAWSGIDDDAAARQAVLLGAHHAALALLDDEETLAGEVEALQRIVSLDCVHALLRGLACRFLHERGAIDVAVFLARELSRGQETGRTAQWVDGLLRDSGSFLAHDASLLGLLSDWVVRHSDAAFIAVLPLLRRTFATFTSAERRRIALGVEELGARPARTRVAQVQRIDERRATMAVEAVVALLGLPAPARATPTDSAPKS